MFFGVVVGLGIGPDFGNPIEDFFGKFALPALGIFAIGGPILSIILGIRFANAHRALVEAGYSTGNEEKGYETRQEDP